MSCPAPAAISVPVSQSSFPDSATSSARAKKKDAGIASGLQASVNAITESNTLLASKKMEYKMQRLRVKEKQNEYEAEDRRRREELGFKERMMQYQLQLAHISDFRGRVGAQSADTDNGQGSTSGTTLVPPQGTGGLDSLEQELWMEFPESRLA
jgi:hypothetical protein